MADCTGTVGPEFPDDTGTGTPAIPGCTPAPLPAADCKPLWELTSQTTDTNFVNGVVSEALAIGGANFNVHKLLGVHEQGKLIDVTGKGQAISGGSPAAFPPSNAFNIFATEWRSLQQGSAAIIASSFIGYDFGDIKTNDNTRRLYSVETGIRKHIMAFAIKQSSNPLARATKVRLERSEDGMKWYGVQAITLPNDDCLNTVLSRHSVPSRYWRLRPIEFTGGTGDRWAVSAFQMFHDYDPTHVDNIQDKILLENRDRDYSLDAITLKGHYDLLDVQSELTRFGIELPSQTIYATFNFAAMIAALGRPLVVGDIIQMPSETQYSASLTPIEKWLEVTDTGWSTEGFTPGWTPTLMRVILQPAYASQETQNLFGDLKENMVPGGLGLMDKGDGHHPIFQDYSDASDTAIAEAKDGVPERGAESSGTIRAWETEEIASAKATGVENLQAIGQNNIGFQTEDAMPPNNAPFTEGDVYPASPAHGAYHRLTYTTIDPSVPARLYRYSTAKGRWIFLEKDRRAMNNNASPVLNEFLTSKNRVPHTQITRKDDC